MTLTTGSPIGPANEDANPAQDPSMRPSAVRPIPVRRLDVDLSTVTSGRWLVDDDPIFSHFLATLSAVFPNGEDFFVTTVRRHRDAVPSGSLLKSQVKGFIGQEAMHGREHRALNARLDELGYDTTRASEGIGRLLQRLLRLRPTTLPLAMTAAAEHLTGTFAEAVLGDERTRRTLFANPDAQALITWHALEELEHKNVAFDVLDRADGRYVVRAGGMVLTLVVLGGYVGFSWARAVYVDRRFLTRATHRVHRHNLRRQRLLSAWSLRKVLSYFRVGFHPDDMDTDGLVAEWAERLAATTTVISPAAPRSA